MAPSTGCCRAPGQCWPHRRHPFAAGDAPVPVHRLSDTETSRCPPEHCPVGSVPLRGRGGGDPIPATICDSPGAVQRSRCPPSTCSGRSRCSLLPRYSGESRCSHPPPVLGTVPVLFPAPRFSRSLMETFCTVAIKPWNPSLRVSLRSHGGGGVSGTGGAPRSSRPPPPLRAVPLVGGGRRPLSLAVGVTCAPLPEGGDRHRRKVTGGGSYRRDRGSGTRYRPVPPRAPPPYPRPRWSPAAPPGPGPGTGAGVAQRGWRAGLDRASPGSAGMRGCYRWGRYPPGPVPGSLGGRWRGFAGGSPPGTAPVPPRRAPRPRPPAGRHHRLKIPAAAAAVGGGGTRGRGRGHTTVLRPGRSPRELGTGRRGDRGSPGRTPAVPGAGHTPPSVRPSVCLSPCRWLRAVAMAENSGSRDSDGSWVLAGGEVRVPRELGGGGGGSWGALGPTVPPVPRPPQGLPVDTVGAEQDPANHEEEMMEEEQEEEEEEEKDGTQDAVPGRWPLRGRGRPGVTPCATGSPLFSASPQPPSPAGPHVLRAPSWR